MSNVTLGGFKQWGGNTEHPAPLALWKTTVTLAAATGSFVPQEQIAGTVVAVWVDPTTLTAAATIKGYMQDDTLSTPDYFLNYTVPNPAVETRSALSKRMRVHGLLRIDVASATAGDSFDLYVWVDPSADDAFNVKIDDISVDLDADTITALSAATGDALRAGSDLPTALNSVTACKLQKSGTPAEIITCAAADTDYAATADIPTGMTYLTVSCPTANVLVAMGEATSATVGIPVPAGLPTTFAVAASGTEADDTPHVQADVAGAEVRLAYSKD